MAASRFDVAPGEGKELAAAQACGEVDGSDGVEVVAGQLVEDDGNLASVQDLDLLVLDLGWADGGGDITREGFAFDGALQRPVQDAVGMAYRASRQRAAVRATGREEGFVPVPHPPRLEFLEDDGAQVRADIQVGNLAVALGRLRAEPDRWRRGLAIGWRATEPPLKVLGQGGFGGLHQRAGICLAQQPCQLALCVLALAADCDIAGLAFAFGIDTHIELQFPALLAAADAASTHYTLLLKRFNVSGLSNRRISAAEAGLSREPKR